MLTTIQRATLTRELVMLVVIKTFASQADLQKAFASKSQPQPQSIEYFTLNLFRWNTLALTNLE